MRTLGKVLVKRYVACGFLFDVRPYLRALRWDDSKADMSIVETEPYYLAQRVQGGGKLYKRT